MAADPALAWGALAPGPFDRAVIALTSRLPDNWLGLRLAILLRRAVTMRLASGALDVERWGLSLRLHPLDNGCEKNLLFTPQMYEAVELAALADEIGGTAALGQPFVFVDIGANVGLFSLFVAAHAEGNVRILAVEPEPGNRARFDFNVAANGTLPITTVPMALGADDGELAIDLDRRDRGGTRTHAVEEGTAAPTVPCTTLLRLLQQQDIAAIDALKIDVEGSEAEVLVPFFRDAPETLWPRLILIEDSRTLWPVDLFPMLGDRGYREIARSRQNVVLRR